MNEDIFELTYKAPKRNGRRDALLFVDRKVSKLEEQHLERLTNAYLNNACACISNTKILDPYTNKQLDPDENFMRSIEENAEIGEQYAYDFRRQILSQVGINAHKGQKFTWKTNRKLGEAISKKLSDDTRY